jgi:hypothetical protein
VVASQGAVWSAVTVSETTTLSMAFSSRPISRLAGEASGLSAICGQNPLNMV